MKTPSPDLDPLPAPEVPAGMEEVQQWDEPATESGARAEPILPPDDSQTVALVEEGIEEADRELRLEDEARADEEIPAEDTAPPTTGILS
jgi:hypothetical protein